MKLSLTERILLLWEKHLAHALRDLHGGRVYLQILFSLPHLKEKKCAASEKGNYSNSTSL